MNKSSQAVAPCGIPAATWCNAIDNPARIVAIEDNGRTFWLKKSTPAQGVFGRWLLSKFSAYLDLPMLNAVHQPGGSQAIATEASRLQQLYASGANVPRVLWQGTEMILISDLGQRFTSYLKHHSTNSALKLEAVSLVFSELNKIHLLGQYLSQAFARNITVAEESGQLVIGFIDFEDDPLQTMSLENAQARDLLLLVYSLSNYFDNCQSEYHALVSEQIEPLPLAVKLQIERFARKFAWLKKLPRRHRFGNGYRRLTSIVDVIRGR